MGGMRRSMLLLATLAVALTACTPTLDWREVRDDRAGLMALLPCKPDQGSRQVPLLGHDTAMRMWGCEAGGVLYTLSVAEVAAAHEVPDALRGWRQATLAHLQAVDTPGRLYAPTGAQPQPESQRLLGQGRQPDGRPVHFELAWFALGRQVVLAGWYASQAPRDGGETFWDGLRLKPVP